MAHRSRRPRGPKTAEEKLYEIDKNFVDTTRVSTVDQIKDSLVRLDRYETELLEAKKTDQDLLSLRSQLTTATKTYSEPLAAIKLKRSFALKVLDEKKGQALETAATKTLETK